jgi:hypothetical protein
MFSCHVPNDVTPTSTGDLRGERNKLRLCSRGTSSQIAHFLTRNQCFIARAPRIDFRQL